MSLPAEEVLPEPANGELVHWMEPAPLRLGPGGITATAAAAFAVGVLATVGALALARWLSPRREALPPWRWGRGPLH